MLGGDQDCYGGCSDPHQAFYGTLDEVRIWKVARKQEDIARDMRKKDLTGQSALVAYWKFDDPLVEEGEARSYKYAADASGNNNHLPLNRLPKQTSGNKMGSSG